MPVVRQALQRVLLMSNDTFWDDNPPPLDAMDKQCIKRRNILALQLYLRLHILVATQGMQPLHNWTCADVMQLALSCCARHGMQKVAVLTQFKQLDFSGRC